MASLLEMRFASEGEEEDTDYVESSSSEQGSQTNSSSSSDDETAAEQRRFHVRAYRSRAAATRRTEDTTGTDAASGGDAAVIPFPSRRLADAGRAPGASAGAETAPEEVAKAAGESGSPPAALPPAAAAATETNSTVEAGESGQRSGGEMQLHGRKKVFSARQRTGTDRKHTRTRDQAFGPHKKRHAERLRACEVFKEMQQAESEALQSYPSMVDPDDFLLQFHRRCPPENSAHTRSWQHLQHHLSIAVSALQLPPRPSGAAGASLPPLRPLDFSSSPSFHVGGALSAAYSASVVGAAAAAFSPEASAVAASTAARDPPMASAVSSLSQELQRSNVVLLQQQHVPPRAPPFSSSAQRLCVAAGDTSAAPPAVVKQQTPAGQTATAATAPLDPTGAPAGTDADLRETITFSRPMEEGSNPIHSPPVVASAAATGSGATGTAATGAAGTGAAVTDGAAIAVVDATIDAAAVQNVQASACVLACSEEVSVARVAPDAAAGAVCTDAAALSATQDSSSSAPAAASGFSIRACKERCRKKLSNATLVKMMQEALHSTWEASHEVEQLLSRIVENAGEISVKKVVRFAGQIVEVEERVEAASAKYQHMLELQRRTPQHIGGRFAGLDGLVAALDGPSSINSVQKSQADWEGYKREKGLAAELAKGHGFLQRQAFLAQTEWKQHEQNVELRRRRQAESR